MKKLLSVFSFLVVCTFAMASFAGETTAPLSTPELKKTIATNGKATLVFFQNPYGGPCKKQKEILDKLAVARKNGFNVVAINAMNQNDQQAFYDYGVRSLPSLVLVDKKGKVNKVFSPGIQSPETLNAALDGAK